MGRFVDAWSKLERQLRNRIEESLGRGTVEARTISYGLSGRGLIDLHTDLIEPYVSGKNVVELKRLAERYNKSNTKRNRLIHGGWSMEYIVGVEGEKVSITAQIVREYPPTNSRERDELGKFGSPLRGKYIFSLDQIDEARRDIESLMEQFRLFHRDVKSAQVS